MAAVVVVAAAAADGAGDLIAPLSDGTRLELPPLAAEVPSPAEFLGYPLGARFTHWSEIGGYLERLAAASDRVAIQDYGTTYEGRPLTLLAISSPANIARLDELRREHLRLAAGGEPGADDPVVVWLAYGVHGNESSSAEAAMAAAYLLAAAAGDWPARLERTVVLIDPLSNPDGRERYVHFYETRRGRVPDPLEDSAEHHEPWPGGRQNHYLVDLNRDWAWATQPETRDRLAAYRSWEPQVYVDFHEMSADSTYFFPPPAEPINPQIDARTAAWLRRFGEGNAAAFDRYGWIYYNAERYDLFYPGYGDSYPSLRGAVGMTYEMAGHGRAGETLRLAHGGMLTLADRIARHLTASLSTAATAASHRQELLADFAASRRRAVATTTRTYLWEPAQPESAAAAALLSRHGIEVGRLEASRTLRARPLGGGAERPRSFPAGTWLVGTGQPLGALVRALMELEAPMSDEFLRRQRQLLEENRRLEFYDITAWSIPLAYNLEVWDLEGSVPAGGSDSAGDLRGEGEFGYLARPQGLAGYRMASALLDAGIRFRFAVRPFRNAGRDYPAGTLFVPRLRNPDAIETTLAALARSHAVTIDRTPTAFSPDGISLGSDSVVPIRAPRLALVGGDGVSPTSYGALWHLLDRDLELPHHRLETRHLGRADLSRFDVLVLPGGFGYADHVDEEAAAALAAWVEGGGVLVAVGGAVAWLRQLELTETKAWQPRESPSDDPNEVVESTPANRRLYVPGAALATTLRDTHPLAAGLASPPAELFMGREILLATGDPGRDVLRVAAGPVLAGFVWPEAAERLEGALLVGVEERGRGAVVTFAQEPAFRLFWRAKLPLFLNAVMFGPSLNEAGWLTR